MNLRYMIIYKICYSNMLVIGYITEDERQKLLKAFKACTYPHDYLFRYKTIEHVFTISKNDIIQALDNAILVIPSQAFKDREMILNSSDDLATRICNLYKINESLNPTKIALKENI